VPGWFSYHTIQAFGPRGGKFIATLTKRILNYKFFAYGGRIFKKTASLSIGEVIATSCSSILRHHLTFVAVERFQRHGSLLLHFGYIDDCLTVLHTDHETALDFCSELDEDIAPLRWEHAISMCRCNFLDLDLAINVQDGRYDIRSSMFRKPSFVPNYLTWFSDHPVHQRAGILLAESHRIRMISDSEGDYLRDMSTMRQHLSRVGHPGHALHIPLYDARSREIRLQRLVSPVALCAQVSMRSKHVDTQSVFLVLPWHNDLRRLRLPSFWEKIRDSIPIHINVVWTNRANSFRALYALNWPIAV
jgi:hypothetical protein